MTEVLISSENKSVDGCKGLVLMKIGRAFRIITEHGMVVTIDPDKKGDSVKEICKHDFNYIYKSTETAELDYELGRFNQAFKPEV